MPEETPTKEVVEKEDGRYIIFYAFDDGTPDEPDDLINKNGEDES